MKVVLWRGFHDPSLLGLLAEAWQGRHLLILCPPHLADWRALRHLAFCEWEFRGSWNHSDELQTPAKVQAVSRESEMAVCDLLSLPPEDRPIIGTFTSGTVNGEQKLVLSSRRNLQTSIDAIYGLFDASSLQAIFCYPQPFHIFGLSLGYLASLLKGFLLLLPEGKYTSKAHSVRAQIHNELLLTLGTPVHFWDLRNYCQRQMAQLPPSYSAIIGGAAVSKVLWHQVREDLRVAEPSVGYGCTEASPGLTHLPPGFAPAADGDIGYVLPQVQWNYIEGRGVEFSGRNRCVAILDSQQCSRPSTILIRDELSLQPDGRWLFKARFDLQLNRGGLKLNLEDVEGGLRRLFHLPTIGVAMPDGRLGQELGLVIQTDSSAEKTEEAVIGWLQQTYGLSLSKLQIRFVNDLPLTANGKLDRVAALRQFEGGSATTSMPLNFFGEL